MRNLLIATLFATVPFMATGQEKGAGEKAPTEKEASIFDEFDVEMPDFSKLPEGKRRAAELKWFEENVGSGIPKTYVRFMERLRKEAKKPAKDSHYIGTWRIKRERKDELVLSGDGTFTWDYGHSKGDGIWKQHEEGIIWIGFAHAEKNEKGEEHIWYAEHFCYLKDANTLIQNHIDYDARYKRHPKLGPVKQERGESGRREILTPVPHITGHTDP